MFIKFTTANRYANRLELGNLLSAGNFLKKAINLQKDFDLKFVQIGHTIGRRIFKEHSLHSYQFWHLGDEKPRNLLHQSSVFKSLLKLIKILLTFLLEKL